MNQNSPIENKKTHHIQQQSTSLKKCFLEVASHPSCLALRLSQIRCIEITVCTWRWHEPFPYLEMCIVCLGHDVNLLGFIPTDYLNARVSNFDPEACFFPLGYRSKLFALLAVAISFGLFIIANYGLLKKNICQVQQWDPVGLHSDKVICKVTTGFFFFHDTHRKRVHTQDK